MNTEIICPGIDEYMKPFLGYIHRSEGRELAESYVAGLLIDGERKSVKPMSEKENASKRSMQRLLSEVRWDNQGVAAEYRRTIQAATADPFGILVLDDTGFPKKGRDSACVARQYCGASGKTDNCQIGVSMTYAGRDVAWPYAMELFIPVWLLDAFASARKKLKNQITSPSFPNRRSCCRFFPARRHIRAGAIRRLSSPGSATAGR